MPLVLRHAMNAALAPDFGSEPVVPPEPFEPGLPNPPNDGRSDAHAAIAFCCFGLNEKDGRGLGDPCWKFGAPLGLAPGVPKRRPPPNAGSFTPAFAKQAVYLAKAWELAPPPNPPRKPPPSPPAAEPVIDGFGAGVFVAASAGITVESIVVAAHKRMKAVLIGVRMFED